MKKSIHLFLIFCLICITYSCQKFTSAGSTESINPTLPESTFDYQLPNSVFNQHKDILKEFPITNEGATLGRVLFYDKKLSINGQTACGSCHFQHKGFADSVAFSAGFEGNKTARNSIAITNVLNNKSFFWDGRVNKLEEMVLLPVQHQVEMGLEKLDVLPTKLANAAYYKTLFKKAFNTEEITNEKIANALTQFLRSMYSTNNNNFQTFEVQNGAWIFSNSRCGSCHGDADFRSNSFENIGLDANYTDNGLGALTNNVAEYGKFKVPSLRNIALTAPYMHDGRFKTLDEVLNHYSKNIKHHANLSNVLHLQTSWGQPIVEDSPEKFNFTNEQKKSLIAFFESLTDDDLINDERFSNPFLKK